MLSNVKYTINTTIFITIELQYTATIMMRTIYSILVKSINYRLLSVLLFGGLIFSPTIAFASYTPQKRKPPKESTRAGGSRGCPGEHKEPLTVLAPHIFVGKTASLHPTLAWFAYKPEETEVHIYEFGIDNKINRTIEIARFKKSQTKKGTNIFKLSQDKALKPGKQYLWQVSIPCADGSFFTQKAEFVVINKPRALEKQIVNAKNISQKADTYARNGLWYEALEEAFNISDKRKSQNFCLNLINDLILVKKNQLDKEQEETRKRYIQQRISSLRAIVIKKKLKLTVVINQSKAIPTKKKVA